MERVQRCEEPLRGCPFKTPYTDSHHIYHPASEYTTPLEVAFREAEVNVIRGICRCIHNLEHLKPPPAKPPIEFMREVVDNERASSQA